MSNQQQSIGMMEGAFFVPKTDLLNWINSSLKLNLTRIQQLGTGAVYCQIIDMMFPGKVSMSKVNWKAKNQWEFLVNLKILQQAFAKCKIHKHIEMERLSKSKYQDNLQFIQWMKRYFDLYNKNDLSSYDPISARKGAQTDFSFLQIRDHPLKRQRDQAKAKVKSRSPYDNIKSKVNINRSVTLQKNSSQNAQLFLGKLNKIKDILKKNGQEGDKLQKIQEIVQDLNDQSQFGQNLQQNVSLKLQTNPSRNAMKSKKKIIKQH